MQAGYQWMTNLHFINCNHKLAFSGCFDLLGLVVLKLNVQTVLNSHLHLYGGVELWICAECVHYNVHLFANVIKSPADGRPQEIAVGIIRV